MQYFTIGEMLYSDTAIDKKIDNYSVTTQEVEQNLRTLIEKVLDPARGRLGCPVKVTSGYRCEVLNKAVGGAATSQHVKGQAADLQVWVNGRFDVQKTRQLFGILQTMDVDQLLYEKSSKGAKWVHVSYVSAAKNRHDIRDNYLVV